MLIHQYPYNAFQQFNAHAINQIFLLSCIQSYVHIPSCIHKKMLRCFIKHAFDEMK